MWLLDVNLPKKVCGLLGEFGIEAHCADDRGWGHLTNGALVSGSTGRFSLHPDTRPPFQRVRRPGAKALSLILSCASNDSATPRRRIPGAVPKGLAPQPDPARRWAVVALAR